MESESTDGWKEGWRDNEVKELLMGAESDAEDRVCREERDSRARRALP